MGWLPGYENDIFISYAHDDNQPQYGSSIGSIDYFEEHLRISVQGMLGKGSQGEKVKIFHDLRLRRFGEFDEQLARSLTSSAVYICVLSPNYLTSEWCKWELAQLLKHGHGSRILKAVLRPVDENEQPEEIRRVLDTRFYRENESPGFVTELRPQIDKDDVAEWARRLETLAQNVVELIKQMQRSHSVPGGDAAKTMTVTPGSSVISQKYVGVEPEAVVYLAETTLDLMKERKDIKSELQQFNCRVLPDQPLPEDTEELLAAVRGYLQEAQLSVHLFGSKYGTRPESEDRSIPHIQYDLAAELGKEQLIWLPKEAVPENELQRQFIAQVRKRSRDWQENILEDFKSEVLKRLKPANNGDDNEPDAGPVNVCFFYHEDDAPDIKPIFSYLTMEELFEVKLSREDVASPDQCKEVLQKSDAVLLYYGRSNLQWLINLLKQIRKFTAIRGPKPILAKAIYSTAPQTEEKLSLDWNDPLVIHNYDGFTPNVLAPFINRIKAAKGAAL